MIFLARLLGSVLASAFLLGVVGLAYIIVAWAAELTWAILLRPKLVSVCIAVSFILSLAIGEAATNIVIALPFAALISPLSAWPAANLLVWLRGREVGLQPTWTGFCKAEWFGAFTFAARARAKSSYVAPSVQL